MPGFFSRLANATNVSKDDIIHRAMNWQIGLLPVILIWALSMESMHAFEIIKGPWDMRAILDAVLAYEAGVGTLLTSGTAALFFRKIANSDGSTEEDTTITKGRQSPQTSVNITNT